MRLELAGKGSGEDLIVERGVEELEREKGPSRKLIRYFHGHNEQSLAFPGFRNVGNILEPPMGFVE